MAHTANTAALSEEWDLQIGSDGSLKTSKDNAAILQAVANECRCFTDDLYFDRLHGIPWFSDQLGQSLRAALVRSALRKAALSVAGVQDVRSVNLTFLGKDDRRLHGSIEVTTEDGLDGTVSF